MINIKFTHFLFWIGVLFTVFSCSSITPLPTQETVKIYYEEKGEGEPILLIHGFGASTYSWRHLISKLSSTYKVIAIDLKGFGKSEKPLDERYSIHDQARIVVDFIEKKDLKNLTIIGHSYGGGVTLATTLRMQEMFPNRLKRIVLIDSIAYDQKLPLFVNILRAPLLGQLGTTVLPPEVQTRSILKLAYFDDDKILDEAVSVYAEPLRKADGRYALLKTAEQIIPENIKSFSKRYKSILLPSLLIWGREDEIVPISIGERLSQAIPNSRFRVLENCGHIPHEEMPEETIRIIMEFLTR